MEAVFRVGDFSGFSAQIPVLPGRKRPEVARVIPPSFSPEYCFDFPWISGAFLPFLEVGIIVLESKQRITDISYWFDIHVTPQGIQIQTGFFDFSYKLNKHL
jgi:hypothetical protein